MHKLKNLDEYINLSKMLSSTDDDFNVAIAAIKSLQLNELYHTLFVKMLPHMKRYKYKEHMFSKDDAIVSMLNNHKEISLSEIFHKCKKSEDEVIKDIFHHIVLNMLKSTYDDYEFVDKHSLNVNIKW
jgi:N-dimethylarginine dimethylaminohydrolase